LPSPDLFREIEETPFREFWYGSTLLARCRANPAPGVVEALALRHFYLSNKDAGSCRVIRQTIMEVDGLEFPWLWAMCLAIDEDSAGQPDDERSAAGVEILGEVGGKPALLRACQLVSEGTPRVQHVAAGVAARLIERYVSIAMQDPPESQVVDLETGKVTRTPMLRIDQALHDREVTDRQLESELFTPLTLPEVDLIGSAILEAPIATTCHEGLWPEFIELLPKWLDCWRSVTYWEVAKLRTDAAHGDAAAQYELGMRFLSGDGVKPDEVEAAAWFRLAAEQGDDSGQNALGASYHQGQGLPRDHELAVDWYLKAASQGNIKAQFNLGLCYAQGEGVPRDHEEALRWYCKAADQGDAEAQMRIGVMYTQGVGVSEDVAKGVSWYRKAAEKGHLGAQVNLATSLYHGMGVDRDEQQAAHWFCNAAKHGVAQAQFSIASILANRGDVVRAYAWFDISAGHGWPGGLDARNGLAAVKEMTPDQVGEAQRLSVELLREIEERRP